MDYEMIVKIPITNVPDDMPLVWVKSKTGVWLTLLINDAELISFERVNKK